MKPEGLPARLRVRKRSSFTAAYEAGNKRVGDHIVLFVRAVETDHCRLGVTATKKIGNAVRRNRARRLVREAFRRLRVQLPVGFDYVVVARQSILRCDARRLGPELLDLAHRATP